jgi:hypothetical protein
MLHGRCWQAIAGIEWVKKNVNLGELNQNSPRAFSAVSAMS